MSKTKTRLYVLDPKAPGKPRLVRAANRAQAFAHIAHTTHTCEAASADDVAELMGQGVVPEMAGEDDDTPERDDSAPAAPQGQAPESPATATDAPQAFPTLELRLEP